MDNQIDAAFPLPEKPENTASDIKNPSDGKEEIRRKIRRLLLRILMLGVFSFLFLAGLCVLLYPYMSNYINQKNQSRVITHYDQKTQSLSLADYSDYLKKAQQYNAKLAQSGITVHDAFEGSQKSLDTKSDYWNTLNVGGAGVMGYLVISKIHLQLSIYHGTDSSVLEEGVGHIEGSSLPVGGENTHAVLTAHTGLPSAEYFTNLDQMKIGDPFELHVLGKVLTYRVDQILTVQPYQVDALSIIKGGDYVTLVTCTPYGINSHRLLVRGARVDDGQQSSIPENKTAHQANQTNPIFVFVKKAFNQSVTALETAYEDVVTFLVVTTEKCFKFFGVQY